MRLLVLLVMLLPFMVAWARPAESITVEGDVIKVANAEYSVNFRASDGSIAGISDAAGGVISAGNSSLWTARFDNDQKLAASDETFSYKVDGERLTLRYDGAVTVAVMVTASEALEMQASVVSSSGHAVRQFCFPGDLALATGEIHDALLPMMPGALLSPTYFSKGQSFVGEYPGIMLADYLAPRSGRGQLALYSQIGDKLQPTVLGYIHVDENTTAFTHSFQTWVADGAGWQSPAVLIRVGQDYPASIAGYRVDNGIDQYPSLTDKLGDAAPTYFAAPLYKLDFAALKLKFADMAAQIIDQLHFPGMIHLVVFQPRGHDKTYPDFLPPDPKWGTQDELAAAVSAAHATGNLVVPYTNFSWWDSNSPTLKHLPDGITIANLSSIKDGHGIPNFETYTGTTGFVMNLHNALVEDKIAEQHAALRNDVGVDGIFEDQWGARAAPYDFNSAGLDTYDPATSYFEGVREHYQRQAADNLMTEEGVDVLAQQGIAFMGTNYLWDMLGYRSATANTTSYYPMAGMLLRDKVLLYQHDLAAETWTDNKDMLRWNLAQGYSLSNAFFDSKLPGLNMANPWLNLVGAF